MPLSEYEDWVRANSIEVVLCDENYQFDEINHLREQGVRTIGRFVWEYFGDEYVHGAKTAFETIYSLTLCERDRYRELGIESPYIPWGIHPELLEPPRRGRRPRPGRSSATTSPARSSAAASRSARSSRPSAAPPAITCGS